ncbi:uncharacterized protein si:ch211-236d3.4 isoform X3 [Amphiprion ocellaris]|uniref:Actin-associated protein FAM107A n=2 Tax=Amphiprion TaxID=80969 RepID=A0AAQ5ZZN9_AMPOC|nr:uncharacterized protein si:ch211-236d3.4 isoform X3 [Amphiprion ocellaris]
MMKRRMMKRRRSIRETLRSCDCCSTLTLTEQQNRHEASSRLRPERRTEPGPGLEPVTEPRPGPGLGVEPGADGSEQPLSELQSDGEICGGVNVEMKPELQRVLESRRRDQQIRQKKQEDEARRKISPLEAELLKRHKKLEELEKQQQQQENLKAPEFVKVKENLRRTSFNSKEEKEV